MPRTSFRQPVARGAIGIFGGTFDPIHAGHMAVAQAALLRFRLEAIHFVPSGRPPHKLEHAPAPFPHRYAMVALACHGQARFLASLAEAPAGSSPRVFYSVKTIRRFRCEFPDCRLYFILGADSFLLLPTWHDYAHLLDACDFIVAARPGFRMDRLEQAVPREHLAAVRITRSDAIALRKTTVHFLAGIHSPISATEIRRRRAAGRSIEGLVPEAVEEYICKQALYR